MLSCGFHLSSGCFTKLSCSISELLEVFLAEAPALLTLTIVSQYRLAAARMSMMHDLADCTFIQSLAVDDDQASNGRCVLLQVLANLPEEFEVCVAMVLIKPLVILYSTPYRV
jgi:hypothetical protein